MFLNLKFNLRKPLLLVVVVFLFGLIGFAQETESKLVESLDVQGNRRLADEEILPYIKTRPGEYYDKQQIQDDLANLLSLGWFYKANTKVLTEPGVRGGINVIFEVRELPLIEEVKYILPETITKEEIIAELKRQTLNIEKGDVYKVQKLKKTRTAIRKYLAERGFDRSKVNFSEEEVNATSLIVEIIIELQ